MKNKKVALLVVCASIALMASGCAMIGSRMNDVKGWLVGNSFECTFYDNFGDKFLTVNGEKIGMDNNVIEETTVNSDGEEETVYSLSSMITINIDGHQIQTCGDTIIFAEEGLEPDAEFKLNDIESAAGGVQDNTYVSGIVNKYKNYFGKSRVVVVKSQLGVPICAYSGNDVYYEVCNDLPKTTKFMIDGKALYVHRSNCQVIDIELIKE